MRNLLVPQRMAAYATKENIEILQPTQLREAKEVRNPPCRVGLRLCLPMTHYSAADASSYASRVSQAQVGAPETLKQKEEAKYRQRLAKVKLTFIKKIASKANIKEMATPVSCTVLLRLLVGGSRCTHS